MPGLKFRNPFKKKDKPKNEQPTTENAGLGVENSERIQELVQTELQQRGGASDAESSLLDLRGQGLSSGDSEDRAFEGLHERARKGDKSQNAWVNAHKKKVERGEMALDIAKPAKDQLQSHTDMLYEMARGERTNWMSRHTKDENKGGTKTGALGKGQMSEVFSARIGERDGVFKRDGGGVNEHAEGQGIDPKLGLNSSRDVASSLVAERMKSNVIAKSEFGEVDGEFGTFMEKVDGVSPLQHTKLEDSGLTPDELEIATKEGLIVNGELVTPNDVDYSNPVVQRDLIELQIMDQLCGQVDRHRGNYKVQKDETGGYTGVKGFDNDLSFGKDSTNWEKATKKTGFMSDLMHTVGLPPMMDESQAQRIEAMDPVSVYQDVRSVLPEEEASSAMLRVWELQDHVQKLRSERKIVGEYNDDTYAKLREGGRGSSYVARDSENQEYYQQGHAKIDEHRRDKQGISANAPEGGGLLSGAKGMKLPEPKKKKGLFGRKKK